MKSGDPRWMAWILVVGGLGFMTLALVLEFRVYPSSGEGAHLSAHFGTGLIATLAGIGLLQTIHWCEAQANAPSQTGASSSA